jgi:hypothetical protein
MKMQPACWNFHELESRPRNLVSKIEKNMLDTMLNTSKQKGKFTLLRTDNKRVFAVATKILHNIRILVSMQRNCYSKSIKFIGMHVAFTQVRWLWE